jgi:hypothetical protein
MNPKAVTSDELFGWKTDEWHDGVLSVIMRDMARNNPPYTPNQVTRGRNVTLCVREMFVREACVCDYVFVR